MMYRFGAFELDLAAVELRCAGEALSLEPQVFGLLALLVENRDRLVSKDEIVEKVWDGRVVSDAAIASRVKSARHALGDDGRAAIHQDAARAGLSLRRASGRRVQRGRRRAAARRPGRTRPRRDGSASRTSVAPVARGAPLPARRRRRAACRARESGAGRPRGGGSEAGAVR